jgi:filamentous hemagglutinin
LALTLGFVSIDERRRHFLLHGTEFAAATEEDYEELADTFLGSKWESPVREKRTANGDLVRYNPVTDEFGRMTASGTIRTFFKESEAA